MAHRMAFPANRGVPLAVKIAQSGDGWLIPYDPGDTSFDLQRNQGLHRGHDQRHGLPDAAAAPPNLGDSRIDVLALDVAPFDAHGADEGPQDVLSVSAVFCDSLGRTVEIRSAGLVLGQGCQHFGGVGANLFFLEEDRWSMRPLQAWARFDVSVNGALTDSSLLGTIALTDPSGEIDVSPAPSLSVTIYPTRVTSDGIRASTPMQAAEELGMAGWNLYWDDVTYHQAPVLSVRAERGDTLAKISKEMSVDPLVLAKANGRNGSDSDPLTPGELVYVPLIVRAASPAPRKVFPSVSLSWKEIMNGWTTLN